MVDTKRLNAVLDWYISNLEDVESIIVADRDGLILASKGKSEDIDEESMGGLSVLVEPVLKRVSSEFKSTGFGAGLIDVENYRLIFVEASDQAILISVNNLLASVDEIFPYAYIAAEKIARILEGKDVSPVIPKLPKLSQLKTEKKLDEFTRVDVEGTYIFKMILGGDGAVGKTSLVQTFVTGQFQKDYKATIGTSIMKKECKFKGWNGVIRFVIWDLAGQKQFQKVRQSYLADAKAGFIVFDVTRPETFESVENWFNEIKQFASKNITLILIGNKIDLEDERKISKEQGEALANELGITYFETSALNKDIVEEAFRLLAFELIKEKIKMK
ncbi:MAG: GTP-binding protein [Promethearchaeota archaeon]